MAERAVSLSHSAPEMPRPSRETFHADMLKYLSQMSREYPFLRAVVDKVQREGYRFEIYDPSDPKAPDALKSRGVDAVTLNGQKKVYFKAHLLFDEKLFAERALDEAKHIQSGKTFQVHPIKHVPGEAALEYVQMARAGQGQWTDLEKQLHELIKEECTAAAVALIKDYRTRTNNPGFRATRDMFPAGADPDEDPLRWCDARMGKTLGSFRRMFEDDLPTRHSQTHMYREDPVVRIERQVTGRLFDYMTSGDIEQHVYAELRQMGLAQ